MDVDVMEDDLNDQSLRSRFSLQCGGATDEFIELNSAFRGTLKTYYLRNGNNSVKDLCHLLTSNKTKIKTLIQNLLTEYGALKFNILTESTYVRPHTFEKQIRTFKTSNITVYEGTSINSILHNMFEKLCREATEYEGKGSGWSLQSSDGILLRFSRYRPLRGSSYIPLPLKIKRKHAVINPKNVNDNNCFQWSILAKHVNSPVISNEYLLLRKKYNFDGISFPTPLKQISKFEKQNPGVSVNVMGLNKDNDVYPLRVCDSEKENHFDLLMFTSSNGIKHYSYISNFSRLVRSQVTKHNNKAVFCKRCLKYYQGPKRDLKLSEHRKVCIPNKPVKVTMPVQDEVGNPPILKFKNFLYKCKLPIVVYADFECMLKKVNEQESARTFVNENHIPMSFCAYAVYDHKSLPESMLLSLPNEPYLYRGVNAASEFMNYLISLANLIGDLSKASIPMLPLTREEKRRFILATHCELCNDEFTWINAPVRDHCHLTGKFRSVLCNSCNLKRQNQNFLPVYIHNSSKYDNHFIVKQLGCDQREINVIPNTNEKFVSFSKRTASDIKLRFIDSYRFLNTSLSELVNNLPKDSFKHTKLFFDEEDIPLVTRKGVYPYEYTDSWDKLNENQLPSREFFFNSMTDSSISDEDYNHALNVWNRFRCNTLGEYSDLYLRTDVLLLADVFENFRNLCLENYELDPSHYLTLPSLTFDAMLKYTQIELELFTCYDMYLFIERGIRGGITSCITRHAKANNVYVEDYDPEKNTSFLTYVDANNLYGWAMSNPMPKDGFKWLSKKGLHRFDVMSIPNDSPVGYVIECDVSYPGYLHNEHNDLPFLPESKCPENSKTVKLLTTLEHKNRYVCHYVNLKQALENGLVLKKIHKVLSFNQSAWLKTYIDFNTEKRKVAKNDFEKNFYKLLNNAMFGKTIENVRKRLNMELVSSQKRLDKLVTKPNFKNVITYDVNLCAVECSRENILFEKPIYIGFSVLELSKYHMYEFHYKVMKAYYKDRLCTLYMDTDSFFYLIFTEDLYADLRSKTLSVHFDFSDYPPNHKCFSTLNKKTLGKFKDECLSIPVVEFVGLRPKLYTFTTKNGQVVKKAKGITKHVVKNQITFDNYKKCLFEDQTLRKNNRLFRSKKHNVDTVTVNKLALSSNDDKRHICNDKVHTMAYGHYKLDSPDLSCIYE